jgi:hypothetical protein
MRTGLITLPDIWEQDWTALDTTRDGNIPGPVWKELSTNDESGACTYLVHFPPNWHDPLLDWHPGAEEGFIIHGAVLVGKPEWGDAYQELGPGDAFYRPAGILHGPARLPDFGGMTSLYRMSKELRIHRYTGTEFPHVHMTPMNDDWKTSPVGWNEQLPTDPLPWVPVTEGGWAGTRHKWVFRNTETNGGVILLDIPAGWEGTGTPTRGSAEEFVLDGSLTAGGVTFGLWGYAHRPPSTPAGSYSTETGARLLCYWDEADELAA